MFGTKIMDTGTKMVAFFQKWALFSFLLTSRKLLYFNQTFIYYLNTLKLNSIFLMYSITLHVVSRCTKKNSCLQVLKGSHRMGRINHNVKGEQAGADLERLKEAQEKFPLVYVEMDPGDALFFHCNLLHSR